MRTARLSLRRQVLIVTLCLVAGASLPAHPALPAAPPRALEDAGEPSGLVVVRSVRNSPQEDRALEERALQNPFITGVAFQIHWSEIEPIKGKPDWSALDALFTAAASAKKWVQLSIYPGFFAPAWALQGAKTQEFPVQYGPAKGKVLELPMPWDVVYLNNWFAFLRELSDRYGASPAFRMIIAAGPTSVSDEMTLPQSAQDLVKWQSASYTSSKYAEAWRKVFQAYAADFPNQFVALVVGDALNIDDQGRIRRGEAMHTRQVIVDEAIRLLGRRFSLENHDLHAAENHQSPATSFVMGYRGRILTGLEMTCAAELCSPEMGAPGNPPVGLRMTIDVGMKPDAAGHRVSYLEVYEPDVLADEMQPVLRYAASLFEQKRER